MTRELEALAAQVLAARTAAAAADDRAANAQQMVRNDRPAIEQAQTTAAAAQAKADAVDVKRSEYEQALASSIADRASIHAQLDALTAGMAGKVNDVSIGSRSITAIVLAGTATITVPLVSPMPTATYRTRISHSAAVDLTKITISNVQRTTTAVTFTLTASGLALAAGTVVVLAVN